MSDFDRRMMALALTVGARGRPSPNPHVGAVIVRDGQIMATGYHHRAGLAHAEIDALQKLGYRAEGATLYVTMEPCNHHGRTGPCSEAVLQAGIARVVMGCEDRIPGHDGGAARLRSAGVQVETSVLADQAEALVEDFYKHAFTGMPYVTLKAAVTLDGRMASRSGDSKWVTGEKARRHVHRMRDRSDAVMVGVGTLLADDPALTVRLAPGKDPLRVIVDSRLLTPLDSQIARTASEVRTLIFHGDSYDHEKAQQLTRQGVELHQVAEADAGLDLFAVMRELGRRGVVRLLVEGGPTLHGALLDAGLVDRAAVFVAPRILADAAAMPLAIAKAKLHMAEALSIVAPTVRRLGDDVLFEGPLQKPGGRAT